MVLSFSHQHRKMLQGKLFCFKALLLVACMLSFFYFNVATSAPLHGNTTGHDIASSLLGVFKQPDRVVSEKRLSHQTNTTETTCPTECRPDWIGDGWCDTACSRPECSNDGNDCDGWCAPDCKSQWIGDGYCDVDCFRAECQYDGGDCKTIYTEEDVIFPRVAHEDFRYAGCPSTCDPSLLRNGLCDDDCNSVACNFDGGDCDHLCSSTCPRAWLGDGECDYGCNTETCHFDKGDCEMCSTGCQSGMIGNGVCDPACNNDKCHYDMGDCYGVCWSAGEIDYFTEPFFYPHCRTEWKGDGFCDCFCMNPSCEFDYGDCNAQNCTLEYSLLLSLYQRLNKTLTDFPPPPSS